MLVNETNHERTKDNAVQDDIFFFQAEDGIRDDLVTGVQTCALPIYDAHSRGTTHHTKGLPRKNGAFYAARSEERRVGKSVDLGGRRIIKKKKIKNIRVGE